MSLLLLFNSGGEAPVVTVCLWNRIDSSLQAQLEATLGGYSTLAVSAVEIGETLDINHVTAPYCLIRGVDARYENESVHGDTEVHFDNILYPYDIIVLAVEDTALDAKSNAKELLRRVREWVRSDFWFANLQDDDGETVVRVEIGDPRMSVVGLGGNDRGKYAGWAIMPLTIESEV